MQFFTCMILVRTRENVLRLTELRLFKEFKFNNTSNFGLTIFIYSWLNIKLNIMGAAVNTVSLLGNCLWHN